MKFSRYLPIWIVAIVCVGVTLSAVRLSKKLESERAYSRFRQQAGTKAIKVKEGIRRILESLVSIQAFYLSSEVVDRSEFKEFTSHILERNTSIQALEWVPRVPDEKREEYVRAARSDGYADFVITEKKDSGEIVKAQSRAEYFPVYYVEPMIGNEKAFGFDLASNMTRRASLMQARDTSQMVATASVTLIQEERDQKGVLVFNPIYKKKSKYDSIEERRKHLLGFALGVYRLGDMVAETLKDDWHEDINLYLFEQTKSKQELLSFYTSKDFNNQKSDVLKGMGIREIRSGVYYEESFDMAGRKWTLFCVPSLSQGAIDQSRRPIIIGIIGGLITLLFVGYLKIQSDRALEIERLVEVRTKALSESKDAAEKDRYIVEQSKGQLEAQKEQLEEALKIAEESRNDLEQINEFMLGREEKIMELRKKVEMLEKELKKKDGQV